MNYQELAALIAEIAITEKMEMEEISLLIHLDSLLIEQRITLKIKFLTNRKEIKSMFSKSKRFSN